MAYMDFIILKVNGTDVSGFPHEDAVKAFLAAQEPIVVEVKRRFSDKAVGVAPKPIAPPTEDTTTTVTKYTALTEPDQVDEGDGGGGVCAGNVAYVGVATDDVGDTEDAAAALVSTAVQTDLSGFGWFDESPLEECLPNDMDLEEVTLRKCSSEERLGLTLCYSSGSGSEEVDICTEVYIQDIISKSVADRDGRLRQGDQILQVNGKDVANKEETETLFAENRKTVTLLVSRCLYQGDEYLDTDYQQDIINSPGDLKTPEYQNSLIEQLINQQAEQSLRNETTLKLPPHISPEHNKQSIEVQTDKLLEKPKITEKQILNNTNSLVRSQIDSINHEISLLNHRMQNIQLVKTSDLKRKPPQLPHIPAPLESDTEHIYETIPEDSVDSELEPIYSSPYEGDQNIVEQWLKSQDNGWQTKKHALVPKPPVKSTKSNSSGEEHENSSSAYNTGGSCNSNPLTFELACNADPRQKDTYRSTLVLCQSKECEEMSVVPQHTDKMPSENCEACRHQSTRPKKNKVQSSKVTSPLSPNSHNTFIEIHAPKKQTLPPHIPADTMYTNVANLQQTMLLQQQLFRQALCRQSFSKESRFGHGEIATKPTTSFTAPSLSQYQFVSSQQVYTNSMDSKTVNTRMEWKVKRRQDGTRYIARRPVRNRILRNRAIRISEERAGLTTEDDTVSELKIGKYWPKEERKRQLERSREKKHRLESMVAGKSIPEDHIDDHVVRIPDKIHSNTAKKTATHVDVKKIRAKKTHNKEGFEDFPTVQEMLVHGPKMGSGPGNKMMGLLSVTTV